MPLNRSFKNAAVSFAILAGIVTAVAGGLQTLGAQAPTDSLSVAADRGRILGSEKAPVWLLIVSDFQCPFCRQWHGETWATLRKEYVATGKVRVAYMNYPLGQHANARPTAAAAMCASAQGKFWPMADALFKTQDGWKDLKDPRSFLDSLAKTIGLDVALQKKCVAAPSIAALVEADRVRSTRAGTRSTPTFFIGPIRLEGVQPIAAFRRAIDTQLAAAAAKKP